MAELIRLRTRDGRYLSDGLRALLKTPTFSETFAVVDASSLPLADGGNLALAACEPDLEPTQRLMVTVSRYVLTGGVANPHWVLEFGGPGTSVYTQTWGPIPPSSTSDPTFLNLFGVHVNSTGEVSLFVVGRSNPWYFRAADVGVFVDGTMPFEDDTAFIVERGPFDCARVTGRITDATDGKPLAGASVTTSEGFSGTADASGNYFLADAGSTTQACVRAGGLTLLAAELTHVSKSVPITVPTQGSTTQDIELTCREIGGIVIGADSKPIKMSKFKVTLTGPKTPCGDGPSRDESLGPNTGRFLFRCVEQGTYQLSYPNAYEVRDAANTRLNASDIPVPDQGRTDLQLIVGISSVAGRVLDNDTMNGISGASVQALGPPPVPSPAFSSGTGEYTLTGLRPGPQPLQAAKDGYVSQNDTVPIPTTGQANKDWFLIKEPPSPTVRAIYNTGVNDSGVVLALGTEDSHWKVIAGPGIPGPQPALVLLKQSPLGTYFQTSDSAWVWVNSDGSGSIGSGYTFRLSFELTATEAATARISGGWGCDNNGELRLNDKPPAGTDERVLSGGTAMNFKEIHFFSLYAPFREGVNTLDVIVTDDANPGALNVTALMLTV